VAGGTTCRRRRARDRADRQAAPAPLLARARGIRQPLSESSRARELLERIPFSTGYAWVAMLLDAYGEVGLRAARAGRPRRPPERAPAAGRASAPMADDVLAAARAARARGAAGAGSARRRVRRAPADGDRARRPHEPAAGRSTSTSTARCSAAAARCCTTARGVHAARRPALEAARGPGAEVVLLGRRRCPAPMRARAVRAPRVLRGGVRARRSTASSSG
jgi:hypothetical protein